MRKGSLAFLIAAFLLAFPLQAETSENSFTLGVGKATLMPYFGHCNGAFCGLSRSILDRFAAEKNIKLTYVVTPVIRVQKQIETGQIDAFFPDNPKWLAGAAERSKLCFSRPVLPYAEGLLVLKQHLPAPVKAWATLYKWELPKQAEKVLAKDAFPLYVQTTPTLIDLLTRKRVDAIYANLAVARHDLKTAGHNPAHIRQHPATTLDIDHYFMSALSGSKLMALFEHWLEKSNIQNTFDLPEIPGAQQAVAGQSSSCPPLLSRRTARAAGL